jgi:hypothetical protein
MISNLDELKLWMLSVIIWLLLGLTWIMPAQALSDPPPGWDHCPGAPPGSNPNREAICDNEGAAQARRPARPEAQTQSTGVQVPPQFRGRWCRSTWETIYRRCREQADEWQFTIDRATLTTEESTCRPLAIRKTGGEYRVRLACKFDEGSQDMPPLSLERWRIGSNGTRLQVLRERE